MKIIDKFHKMELDYSLFELGKEINLPVWDIFRHYVYLKYYYPEKDRQNLYVPKKLSFSDYFYLAYHLVRFIFKVLFNNRSNIVLTSSRYIDSNGKSFDKSALSIIEVLSKKCLVLEPIVGKNLAYTYIYDFNSGFRKIFIRKKIPIEYYDKLNKALINIFGKSLISYEEVNNVFHRFKSDYFFYKTLFSYMKPKKLFIAIGNPKAALMTAKELYIPTHLIQHGSIEFDDVQFSYPSSIKNNSNVLFSQYLLTYGDFWGRNINIPVAKIIPIGNDFFYSKPNYTSDNSILVISTIVHGRELSLLTKNLAILRPDFRFVYKLHPGEFQLYNDYVAFFKGNINVSVLTNEIDTSILVANAQLVIVIVSTVLYEALNNNKKVAIYKKINYEKYLSISNLPNLYFFDNPEEIFDILQKDSIPSEVNFYKPTDYALIKQIIES